MGQREYYIMGRVQMVVNLNINSELHKTDLISQIKDCVSSYVHHKTRYLTCIQIALRAQVVVQQ